jgi:polyhydroxybutyrate depolymerase
LPFFQTVQTELPKQGCKIDPSRVYATGFSNGANFTAILWSAHPGDFAAVALVAGVEKKYQGQLQKPVPCMHIAGQADKTIDFNLQLASKNWVLANVNRCDEKKGQPWWHQPTDPTHGILYNPSPGGKQYVWVVHPGGHEVPSFARDLLPLFFKAHSK